MKPDEAVTEGKPGVFIRVWVIPGARGRSVVGISEGYLRIRVHSRAEGGHANAELVQLLADVLSVPVSMVEIVKGATSRRKLLLVRGMTRPAAIAKLQGWAGTGAPT